MALQAMADKPANDPHRDDLQRHDPTEDRSVNRLLLVFTVSVCLLGMALINFAGSRHP